MVCNYKRGFMLSSVAFPAHIIFSPHYLSYRAWLFGVGGGGEVIELGMYVLILSANSVWSISYSKNYSRRYYHHCAKVCM